MEQACDLLEKGKVALKSNVAPSVEGKISMEYLEGVAMLRYSFAVIAELIHSDYIDQQKTYTHESQILLDMAKTCCSDATLNSDDTGPNVFLVKLLARKYGVTFLTNLIASHQSMEWIVPQHLHQLEKVI